MWTVLWLAIAVFIGFEVSLFLSEANPLIGASIGFGSGSMLRLAIATGNGELFMDVLEGIGDIIGAIFEGIGN